MVEIIKRSSCGVLIFISLFAFTACFNGGTNIEIPSVKGPTVTLHQDEVQIVATVTNVRVDDELRYDIPKFDHSYLTVNNDSSGDGVIVDVRLSLVDILGDDVVLLPPQFLPGGRNLPGVASGSLPASAFTIPEFHNLTAYVGKDVFGIFIPVKFEIDDYIGTFRFHIGKKRAGNISIVGRDSNGENSGFLLLLDMKGGVKRYLKRQKRKYSHLH